MISITTQSHANAAAVGYRRSTGKTKHHTPKARNTTFSSTKARSRFEDTRPVSNRAGGNDSQRRPKYSSIEWAAWARTNAPKVI